MFSVPSFRSVRPLVLVTALVAATLVTAVPVAEAQTPLTVSLGAADQFAILAGTPDITNVAPSVITGDVGLSPASAATSSVTCTDLIGTSKFYTVTAAGPGSPCQVEDPVLLTAAKAALVAAYDDAAARIPVTIVPSELGGTTKTPGVYGAASTAFGITAGAGPLVLDAQGDPNGVFIFQAPLDATGLTAGPGSIVQLTGGAQACNVFWRLNSATIDTTATFKGNILALTSITVNTGANVEGRLLARNGTVTLQQNVITRSVCAAAPPAAPPIGAPPAFTG